MSNTKSSKSEPSGLSEQTAEAIAAQIKSLLGGADGFILVGTIDPEFSAVTEDETGALVREFVPLGQGVHLVFSVDLPAKNLAGIHEV